MSQTYRSHAGLLRAAMIAGLAIVPAAFGQNHDQCVQHPCPPKYKYIHEGAPRIKFKHGCPKPICDPCQLPHYGYFQTCWHPWPFPPDWSHCPVPPPGALVPPDVPPGRKYLNEPPMQGGEPGPLPRREGTDRPSSFTPSPSNDSERTLPAVGSEPSPFTPPVVDKATGSTGTKETGMPPDRPPPAEYLPPASLPPLGPEDPPPPVRPGSPEPPLAAPETSVANPPKPEATSPIKQTSATAATTQPSPAQRPRKIDAGPAGATMRMVNSRRILLDFDLADVPKPEQSVLELWFTQDGRTWEKDQTNLKSGSPYEIEVNREGTYGFTLLARRIGEQSDPPATGEAPQVWVEVDWTKPIVHMVHAKPSEGRARQLSIVWIATDNNLSPQPITLSWAESPEGPWRTFATKIENSGRYLWQVPGNVPARVYVRVEAFDLVGNAGTAHTPAPILVPNMQ